MSDRVQVECLKQGSIDTAKWSSRVLTIDSRTGTLTISRCGHPENTFYHALKPTAVQQWPHFCATAIDDNFYSVEAKRTICFFGARTAVPDFAEEEVALVGIPLPATAQSGNNAPPLAHPQQGLRVEGSSIGSTHQGEVVEAAQAVPAVTPQRLPLTSTHSDSKRRQERYGKFDAWVLRFPDKVTFDVVTHMLREMFVVQFAGDSARQKRHSRLRRQERAVLATVPDMDG